MSFLAYIVFVAVLEVALVWNVRYLFSRHPLPTLIAVTIFILGLLPPIIKLQQLPQLSPLYTIFLAFVFCGFNVFGHYGNLWISCSKVRSFKSDRAG